MPGVAAIFVKKAQGYGRQNVPATVLPLGLSKKKKKKRNKCPFPRKKNTNSIKKEHFLTLFFILEGYFVYLFLHKKNLFSMFKTINFLL